MARTARAGRPADVGRLRHGPHLAHHRQLAGALPDGARARRRGAAEAPRSLARRGRRIPDHADHIRGAQAHTDWTQMSTPDLKTRRAKLSPIQYAVTQEARTEPPFTGAYWDHHGEGTYRCVVCEEPLFDSGTKFESGTGWPSFYDVIEKGHVTSKEDRTLGMRRTEVTCANCGAHLGHLFPDGPRPTGMRYCINSAA